MVPMHPWVEVQSDRIANVLPAAAGALGQSLKRISSGVREARTADEFAAILATAKARAEYMAGVIDLLRTPPRYPVELVALVFDDALDHFTAATVEVRRAVDGFDNTEEWLDALDERIDACSREIELGNAALARATDALG
jgi:hypothetical protein